MGSTVSTIKEEVTKGAEQGHEDVIHVIDALQELADTKAKLFYAELLSTDKIKEYHISHVQSLQLKTFVSVSEQSDVVKEVGEAVGSMMNGDWLKGIVNLFSSAFNTVIGSGTGEQTEQRQSYVFVSGIGINRLDFYLYKREVKFKQFSSKNTKVFVVGYALSSINVKEMSVADLNQVVSNKVFYDENKQEITDQITLLKKQKEYVTLLAEANGIESK